MENENNIELILKPHERPKSVGKWMVLSLQHVFAMFGATVLVPMVINQNAGTEVINISMALFCSGIGTLIYIALTAAKVPIYLGSSFSYMSILGIGFSTQAGGYGWGNAIFIGIFLVGVVYMLVGVLIHFTGVQWIKKTFSPIIVGPIVMIIGLSAIKSALSNSGIIYEKSTDPALNYPQYLAIIIAFVTFLSAAICMLKAKSFFKVIPILVALMIGYVLTLVLHFSLSGTDIKLVDTSLITNTKDWSWYPSFKKIWDVKPSSIGPAALAIVPISIVTMVEHLGDHINIGNMTNKDFVKDPGISRTLFADGVAMSLAGAIGGPANATYAENTSVVSITKVASVWVTGLAAVMALIMSFVAPINQLILMIPKPVMGGISIMLFGMISSNGIKILIDNKTDFRDARNLIIISLVVAIGVGMGVTDSVIMIGKSFTITGLFLATFVGIILNLLLPKHDNLGVFSWIGSIQNRKENNEKKPKIEKSKKESEKVKK
ncbi:uracil permease [Spiroplasma chinense]|uniref:Uracil permease n=1 Tax=Spiroplasma chinense TaxID=216932 RepID=A0A5B9Y483_9MOLU|nr:uracil-xanthine permease family protein [Spiroplasma chinense]QEH61978.1 uracil permease [Spiroplasma chinense]